MPDASPRPRLPRQASIADTASGVGNGKTMLCRMLLERLPANVETLYIAQPTLSPDEMLETLADKGLLAAFAAGRHDVTEQDVRAAQHDAQVGLGPHLHLAWSSFIAVPGRTCAPWRYAALIFLLGALVALATLTGYNLGRSTPPPRPVTASPVAAAHPPPMTPLAYLSLAEPRHS